MAGAAHFQLHRLHTASTRSDAAAFGMCIRWLTSEGGENAFFLSLAKSLASMRFCIGVFFSH